ncbi:MAG: hypothetical protein JNK02_05415 [Planctomycetes bacterium]|nr:hypothetical protein [Planctomycetota bacterium]
MSGASDRWNPIFLKELRQSLRGRVFGILFPTTVLAGVAVAITAMVDLHPRPIAGPDVLLPVLVVLGVAALGLVPFSAFQSMGGEWDDGTHDLLVLSHLSPGRIVLGKLLSAAVESVLYFAGFAPVLLFTFLLSGVDLRDLLFLIGALYAASIAMSAVALALAGLTRSRFWRVVLLAATAGLAFLALVLGYDLAETFVKRGRGLGTGHASEDVAATIGLILAFGTLFTAIASTRLAHPEDDRSGPVRWTVSGLLVALLAAVTTVGAGFMSSVPVFEVAALVGALAAAFAVFFVTEPERLPRRAAARVPRNAALAVLAAPFLPGGGRGVLWWLLQLAILAAWATAVAAWHGAGRARPWTPGTFGQWCAFQSYFLVYLAGFSLALGRVRERSYGPLAARLILPSVAVLSMVLPLLAGFLSGETNPIRDSILFPTGAMQREPHAPKSLVALVVGGVVLALNLPRLITSFAQVLAASARRRRPLPAPLERPTDAAHAG